MSSAVFIEMDRGLSFEPEPDSGKNCLVWLRSSQWGQGARQPVGVVRCGLKTSHLENYISGRRAAVQLPLNQNDFLSRRAWRRRFAHDQLGLNLAMNWSN